MERAEIIAGIASLKPWFHQIELEGIKTKTKSVAGEPADHPHGTWKIVKKCLPKDLSHKTVLDIGCNAGFYAIEAKRRNAAYVLGVDSQRLHVRQARFVNRVLGLDLDFRRMSLYELNPAEIGQFDVTLALGLIYHCKHLIFGLEKLFQITKELLILESAILPPKKTPQPIKLGFRPSQKLLYPLAYVKNDFHAKEAAENWFLPSPECLQAMLLNVGFAQVEIFSVSDSRTVMMARKNDSYLLSSTPVGLKAALTLEEAPKTCRPKAEISYRIWSENIGIAKWLAPGENRTHGAVFLSVHILDQAEEILAWDYAREPIKEELEPGDRVCLEIWLQAPDTPGSYLIEFDMVSEHVTWFEDLGSSTLSLELEVA